MDSRSCSPRNRSRQRWNRRGPSRAFPSFSGRSCWLSHPYRPPCSRRANQAGTVAVLGAAAAGGVSGASCHTKSPRFPWFFASVRTNHRLPLLCLGLGGAVGVVRELFAKKKKKKKEWENRCIPCQPVLFACSVSIDSPFSGCGPGFVDVLAVLDWIAALLSCWLELGCYPSCCPRTKPYFPAPSPPTAIPTTRVLPARPWRPAARRQSRDRSIPAGVLSGLLGTMISISSKKRPRRSRR
jgi:hypothetical protein